MNRREFIPLAAAGLLTGYAGFRGGRQSVPQRDARSSVTLRKVASYQEDLAGTIIDSLREMGVDVTGKKVLLKPNLTGVSGDEHTNTHAAVVAAAFAAFQELGAAEVRIGDAPEFHRDTYALAEAAGYRDRIPNFDDVFVDLNGDDVSPVQGLAGDSELYLPTTALRADLVVSLAKMKTDTRFGAALSMTNLFGLIPGAIYGWSEEKSHGLGTPKEATELTRIFRRSLAIVDGVWGMEGDGPVSGNAKAAGVLAIGTDLVAVDATCCRVMGFDPGDIEYLKLAANRQGVVDEDRIEQRGEAIHDVRTNFRPATLRQA
jgi:uncharacterized protein (DUF362 family)